MRNLLLILVMIGLLAACSDEGNTVDHSDKTWKLLSSTDATPAALSIQQYPGNSVVNADVYLEKNGVKLTGPIKKMATYYGYLYLLVPSQKSLFVLNSSTYKLDTVINFSSLNLEPSDVCFPNPSNAYISFSNSGEVRILDLRNFHMASNIIKVGSNPVAITCSGNRIFTANQGDNTVSVIASNTNVVVTTLQVATAPTFLEKTSDGNIVLVVSLGAGKLGGSEAKTPAMVTLINVASESIKTTMELGVGSSSYSSTNFVPTGIAVATERDDAFVTGNSCLLGFDALKAAKAYLISETGYQSICYYYYKNLLICSNSTTSADLIDAASEKKSGTVLFPQAVSCFMPL